MPGRLFGSVSKAELLKQVFAPVTFATQMIPIPTSAPSIAALIDHAGDAAYMILQLPRSFTVCTHCYLHFVGNANVADMNIAGATDFREAGDMIDAFTIAQALNFPTVNLQTFDVDLTNLIGNADLHPGTILSLGLWYTVLATATNLYVLGASLAWV